MSFKAQFRVSSLDAARALACCCVVLLHVLCGYLKYPSPVWQRYDNHYSIVCDFISCAIHMFTMPVFFFLAGLFSYRLLDKGGWLNFIKNRTSRILLPLTLLLAITNSSELIKNHWNTINLYHLWFLYYLLYCYLSLGLIKLQRIRKISEYITKLNVYKQSAIVIPSTFVVLYLGGFWYASTAVSLMPNIWLLAFCWIYFFMGVLVGKQDFNKHFSMHFSSFGIAIICYVLFLSIILNSPLPALRGLAVFCFVTASYYSFYSFLSICVTYFREFNPLLFLVARASYTVYLSHIFFILIIHHYVTLMTDSLWLQVMIIFFSTMFLSLGVRWMLSLATIRPPSSPAAIKSK